MNIKVDFLNSYLDEFPANVGDVSDDHGKRFHQVINVMEERYQGQWDTHKMADNVLLKYSQRLSGHAYHSRKSRKRKLFHKHARQAFLSN